MGSPVLSDRSDGHPLARRSLDGTFQEFSLAKGDVGPMTVGNANDGIQWPNRASRTYAGEKS
jgi:hypothetical protein